MSHIAKHNYSDSPEFKINIYFNKDKEVVKKKKLRPSNVWVWKLNVLMHFKYVDLKEDIFFKYEFT